MTPVFFSSTRMILLECHESSALFYRHVFLMHTFTNPIPLKYKCQNICYVGLGTSTLDWAPRWHMWYNKIVLCFQTILTFLGSYAITSSRERESYPMTSYKFLTSQLQFEDLIWQSSWLAIANRMTWIPFRSSDQICMRSWKWAQT
jgi:hypothetical protein